jgi:hypothetical protein
MKLTLILLLLFVPLAYGQEEEIPSEAPTAEQQEIAGLKIDLLLQRRATLQAKATWLDREQRIIQSEDVQWRADQKKLAEELAETFRCEGAYSLEKRACSEE